MDPYVTLAQQAITAYAADNKIIDPQAGLQEELLGTRAGVFVSLHSKTTNELRGCIGTSEPQESSIAREIISNAIAAGFGDSRFSQLTEKDLDDLEISVDILSELEEITDTGLLDPTKFGLLVKNQNNRSGLLLPDIGIESVEEQILICCQKGGINPAKDTLRYFRFTVERHA